MSQLDAESYRRTHPRQFMDQVCTQAVRYRVNAQLGEEDRTKPIGRSLYGILLHQMAKAAFDYAVQKNISPDDFESDVLECGLSVVDNLRSCFVQDWSDRTLDFWRHERNPLDRIKAKKVPYIDRSSLETVIGDYLALPYRSETMDRFLIRALIAMEFYAFGDEMLNEQTFGFPARSPLKQTHVILSYLRGMLLNAIFFSVIAALGFVASSYGWLGESAANWIAGICFSLFLFFTVTATGALPFAWFNQIKGRRHVAKLLSAMSTIYNELWSDGPISAEFIRDRAVAATDKGVMWPAPLFALLDDIKARTGRF